MRLIPDLETKLRDLNKILVDLKSAVIGFSGGADSTFLAAAAHRALGGGAIAITAYSATLPESEKEEAVALAAQVGIRHVLLYNSELDSPDFVRNDGDRCYYCKKGRFGALADWAAEHGFEWVLEGSNADDRSDYRPGLRAVTELPTVRSPLLEAELSKQDIRDLSKNWGLPTWDKPSAACLSSRVAYGQAVTKENLGQIEKAEAFLKRYCKGQVRVRHHGRLARIEVAPEEIPVLTEPAAANEVAAALRKLGFAFVTLDLAGYHMGSMNRLLETK